MWVWIWCTFNALASWDFNFQRGTRKRLQCKGRFIKVREGSGYQEINLLALRIAQTVSVMNLWLGVSQLSRSDFWKQGSSQILNIGNRPLIF